MTDDQLRDLADHEAIEAVHVPEDRPNSVTTRAGTHRGDILDFFVETDDNYVKFAYVSGPNGLRWGRFDPCSKDGNTVDLVAAHVDEEYRPLEGDA